MPAKSKFGKYISTLKGLQWVLQFSHQGEGQVGTWDFHSHPGCNKEPHRLMYQERSSGELGLVTLPSSSEAAASSLALMEQH